MDINQIINGSSILDDFQSEDFNIHIKIQQRNGRKSWTFIEGLLHLKQKGKDDDEFMTNIAKKIKHKFNCGASISKPDYTIKMMGDHREGIKQHILENFQIKEDQIKIHGF